MLTDPAEVVDYVQKKIQEQARPASGAAKTKAFMLGNANRRYS